MLELFIKGFFIGLSISVPLGPIGMLCIQRTLSGGQKSGIATGLGATASDLIYALITLFFLSFILSFIKTHALVIELAVSVIIALFGVYIFRSNPNAQPKPKDRQDTSLFFDFISSFGLTFSNPLIIFVLIALFARLEFVSIEDSVLKQLVGLVFILFGAGFWWFTLTYIVGHFQKKITRKGLKFVNRLSGTIIILIGALGFFGALINH